MNKLITKQSLYKQKVFFNGETLPTFWVNHNTCKKVTSRERKKKLSPLLPALCVPKDVSC